MRNVSLCLLYLAGYNNLNVGHCQGSMRNFGSRSTIGYETSGTTTVTDIGRMPIWRGIQNITT